MNPTNKFESINNEDFFVWVAPDGNMQLTTIASDELTCMAISRLLHKKGIGKSPHEMMLTGFIIKKVKVTITKA